ITEALNIHQGRINEVAEYLQIPRKKLYLRMKKYGLSKEHYKLKNWNRPSFPCWKCWRQTA
ncbi:hypothetical protein MJI46_31030, partial [Salmonella enterica subsp. enterica serovar Cerro]|nr:hypothetical protein [Salmonella enterica subsp. enterica serovar Cerro]